MEKMNGKSKDLLKTNIEELKKIFPSVVTDGKIDFEMLKTLLGDDIEESKERYQFTWNGKSKSIRNAQTPSKGTLRPSKEDSVNWESTENLYIEGDNLEVLKLLQKTYYNKIKLIYADPPYNTGNNIIYRNNFEIGLKQIKDDQGDNQILGGEYFNNNLTSASFHTDWLNMMYSRITLSRNLLSEDGLFVISIDHNELHNLLKICDEIYGESNRLGIVTVVHKPEGRNQEKYFATSTEYAVFYAKNSSIYEFEPAILDEKLLKEYKYSDKIGKYKLNPLMRVKDGAHFKNINLENFAYPIYVNNETMELSLNEVEGYNAVYPISSTGRQYRWRMIKETVSDLINKNEILAKKINGNIQIFEKYRTTRGQLIKTHWDDKKYNATAHGTRVLNQLMDGNTFDFPKSLYLIEDIIKLGSKKNSVVMDIFSGSSTTAHAVMRLNAEDGGNRKFIMVQLPEEIDENSDAFKAGYKTISEIGRERIKRAGKQILEENNFTESDLDVGFKTFKLDTSNIIPWDNTMKHDENTLFDELEVFKMDRTEEDIIYEIMLKYGILDQKVEEKTINDKKIYSIAEGYTIIFIANNITTEDVEEIGKLQPIKVIFRESGFADDNVKLNAVQTLKSFGVDEVKSI